VDAHVQSLVSVVKMFEDYITEKQCSLVRFCEQKGSMQRISINRCFLFIAGSVRHVKWFTSWSRNSLKDI
jgi:hypothetical protein